MSTTLLLIIALVVASMVLFMMEILTPSFGVLTACGLAATAFAVKLAFDISSTFGVLLLLGLIIGMPIYVFLMVKWLPGTALGRKVFLMRASCGTGDGTPEAEKHRSLVGKTGVAETQLRPSGAVRIEQQRVVALAESGLIDKGKAVTVIEASGSNVIVRESES